MSRGASLVRGDALRIPLRDDRVDLVVTSPPYFGQRSYRDGDTHYDGQVGDEATPTEFLRALWAVMDELYRVVKPTGVVVVNLGDKMAGSGGGNDQTGLGEARGDQAEDMDRRGSPRRYVQTHASKSRPGEARAKSVLGLPWRFALGCSMPLYYRAPFEPEPRDWPAWINRRPLVWEKPNGMPESVEDRPRANVEDFFVFTKEERYYHAVDELRPHAGPDGGRGRLPGSVWTIPTEPLVVPDWLGVDHFAAFPTEWPRRLIVGFSPSGICSACGEGRRPVVERPRNVDFDHVDRHKGPGAVGVNGCATGKEGAWGRWEGGPSVRMTGETACACAIPSAPTRPAVVLDPFGGTGTVAMVARTLGRFGVSLDLSADYLRLARWRVFDSGHAARVERRTWTERQGALL